MNIKLLANLDFAAKLNSVEAVTESGKDFLKNYRGYMYQNPASCGIVNGFIKESQNYGYDSGIMSITKSILKYIDENRISWKLASACEKVSNNNSSYNYIAKLGVAQVEKLLEMNESEVIQYIKGGCLKNVQYIPEFRNVCKEVFQSSITEERNVSYNVNTPISYVSIVENTQYFSILGKTYQLKDGSVKLLNEGINDIKFNRINSLLPNFKMIDENLFFEYKANYTSEPFKFTISENSINFQKAKINETFETTTAFNQYADAFAKQLFGNEKTAFLNTCHAISEVYEAFDNIVFVDCAKVMECSDNTQLVITEAEKNVNVNVAKSLHYGTSNFSFDTVTEAMKTVEKISGNNISNLYQKRINEELKAENMDEYKSIQEQLSAAKNEQISFRRRKITLLAEQFKNDPVKIALLNNAAKELAILEAN